MSDRTKTVLFGGCVFVLTVFVLAMVGAQLGANWQTFVPDLLVGVVTAGGLAGMIAWVQISSDRRRANDDAVTRAYEELLDSLGELQFIDLTSRGPLHQMSRVGVKMINFVERSESTDGALTVWLEAERRYIRHLALTCALQITDDDDATARELKSVPFRQHLQHLVANIRRHRIADISTEVREQARMIEEELRRLGRWDDTQTGV